MNKKIIVTAFLLAAGLFATRNAQAQRTYEEMERLTVNEQVTTVITATEPVRFVDISTDKVAGDQPIENIIRLKPKETGHEDGEVLAIVTIVTGTLSHAVCTHLHHADKRGGGRQGNSATGTGCLQQSYGLDVHSRHGAFCKTGVELARENPQRGDQGAPEW